MKAKTYIVKVAADGTVAREEFNHADLIGQLQVGDGVFAAHEPDGEARGLTEAECEAIERMLARLGAKVAGKDAAR